MTELAPLQPGRSWVALRSPAMELAQYVADTSFVPKGLRGNAPAIAACILYGDELGLGPMQALARISMIDGTPSVRAETQRALVLAQGHEIWVVEATSTRVTVAGRRRGSQQSSEVTWTMDDAKRAGLSGKPSYRAYPRQMLTARATAELVRTVFADVVGGLVATEEIDDEAVLDVDGEGEVVEAKPTSKRKRKSAGTASASTAAEEPRQSEADTGADLLDALEGAETGERELADDPTPGLAESVAAAEAAPLAAKAEQSAEIAELMNDQQRRRMQATFREMGVTGRESRLEYCSKVAGRRLSSSNELTLAEANAVIDALEAWKATPTGGPFQDDIPY